MPPAERQQAATHALQDLVYVQHGDRHANHLARVAALGHHEPVPVVDELQLARVGVEVALAVGREAPVIRPGRVVDLGEGVELGAQLQAAHRAHADVVL